MSEIRREVQLDPAVVPALDPTVLSLSDVEREFLHETIAADEEELRAKLSHIQKVAYEQHPYPCIRAFHFVNLMMSLNPVYSTVLNNGKKGNALLLDLGCCMGTDLRKLVHDGYPTNMVLGCDLREEFIDCGYQLYNDKDKCQIRFFTDDIFRIPYPPTPVPESRSQSLASFTGKLTYIYTGALFHLFDEPTQHALALRLTAFLKRETGAIIFGRHQGLEQEGLIDDHMNRIRYGHSEISWKKLWRGVFSEIESPAYAEEHVRVNAQLTIGYGGAVLGARMQTRMLYWSVELV